ncbi:MAG TPA: OsmC family protein [Methylomirabilota bacterium]
MTDGVKIDTVRSGSSGVLGRSLNSARHQHFVLDSPSGPNEAITNGEAFLAGISSCGVTLIEKHAHDTGVPLASMEVVIEGIRSNATPNRFQAIHVRFALRGVDQSTARSLVETWQDR